MTVAYTANLVAFMTEPGKDEPLNTLEKVLKTDISIGMYNYQVNKRFKI